MNFVKLGSLTINLDLIAYWNVIPKAEYEKKPNPLSSASEVFRFYRPSDQPIIVVHFVGDDKPLILAVPPALAFLKLMHESGDVREAQLELPAAAPSGDGS